MRGLIGLFDCKGINNETAAIHSIDNLFRDFRVLSTPEVYFILTELPSQWLRGLNEELLVLLILNYFY